MEASGVKLVVSSPAFSDRVCGNGLRKMLVVDQGLLTELPNYLASEPCSKVNSTNGAFMMFTSGTTGNPKGIVQGHDAFATHCRDNSTAMQISAESRTFQFSSYSFDTSFSDMFITFIRGGTVCVPSDDARLNNLAGSITEFKASVMCVTPTVADQLGPDDVRCLKALVVGGEALTEDIISRWANRVTLINIYGVTECVRP